VSSEGQAVIVDDGQLTGDGEWHVVTAAMALDVVPIGDGNVKITPCLELNAHALRSLHIHEIVHGFRVQQHGEAGAIDVDDELHGPAEAWRNVGGSVERYGGRLGVGRQWHVLFITYDLNDKQLFAYLLVAVCEHIVAVKAVIIFAALHDLCRC
jgi:hypothetical protein